MTDLNQQKSKLHTHAEVDEENTDDIVYEADKGAASGSAPAGNGRLQATDPASANLYTFSPAELKANMDKMKELPHKPYVMLLLVKGVYVCRSCGTLLSTPCNGVPQLPQ